MAVANAIITNEYFDPIEITDHLKNVEYIIMAAPAPEHFKDAPIHFTIFLNTADKLPQDAKDAILDKFLDDNGIKNPKGRTNEWNDVETFMSKYIHSGKKISL